MKLWFDCCYWRILCICKTTTSPASRTTESDCHWKWPKSCLRQALVQSLSLYDLVHFFLWPTGHVSLCNTSTGQYCRICSAHHKCPPQRIFHSVIWRLSMILSLQQIQLWLLQLNLVLAKMPKTSCRRSDFK